MTLIGIMGLLRQLLKLKPWKGEILVGHGFRSGSGSTSRMQIKEFSFGVRCKLEIFPLGSGSGSKKQSHWTYCMILDLVCKHALVFLAFKLMHSAHGENAVVKAGREKKKVLK